MAITVEERINAPRERGWELTTDPDAGEDMISGIQSVEVLDRPAEGVVGLKWREKRVMFGKEATETMWISAAETNRFYETTAHNHGMVYNTRISLDDVDDQTLLKMEFSAKPETIGAKLMSPIAALFNGAVRKALQKDLGDIRKTAESG